MTSYDEVQYESYSYSFTHPEQLYTAAKLFGLSPVPFDQCRILELGCATGGNIIPMAYNMPGCCITGVELSEKQAALGQQQIKDLDLENISILNQSILEIDDSYGKFDYIICHGVYSWVPEEVRDKILAVCRDNMDENGVAIITYNTLPGWNSVKTIRDMMLYHIKDFKTPEEKAEQARSILHFVYEGLDGQKKPYSEFLKSEIELLAGYSDQYLLHDHLEAMNRPLYFYQFIDQIKRSGLRYLADAPLANMYHHNLPEKAACEIDKLKDVVRIGQYMDFIRNQRFRSTLICHDNDVVNKFLNRKLKPGNLKDYCYALSGVIDEKERTKLYKQLDDGVEVTVPIDKRSLTLTNKLSKIALLVLSGQQNRPFSFKDFASGVMESSENTDRDKIEHFLLYNFSIAELVLAGIVEIYSRKGDFCIEMTERPNVSPLARYQARNKGFVTSRLHQTVHLTLEQRVIIQYLDGKYTIGEIIGKITEHFRKNELIMQYKDGKPVEDEAEIDKRVAGICFEGLEKFRKRGLIIS